MGTSAAADYWKQRLLGKPPLLLLPTDRPRGTAALNAPLYTVWPGSCTIPCTILPCMHLVSLPPCMCTPRAWPPRLHTPRLHVVLAHHASSAVPHATAAHMSGRPIALKC